MTIVKLKFDTFSPHGNFIYSIEQSIQVLLYAFNWVLGNCANVYPQSPGNDFATIWRQ